MNKKSVNFDELIELVRTCENRKLPGEIARLDQLDAKMSEAFKLYGVNLNNNSVKAALVAFAMIDPKERTCEELSIVTCLSRHVTDN